MSELTTNVPDTALVFEGGGYRASYTGGFARVLLEQEFYFPFVCGLSAGASHTVDYVSRDLHRTRDAFLAHKPEGVHPNGLASILQGTGYFNADYLYEGCIDDGTLPFDWETFCANPADVRIQAYERDTGRTQVWSKADMTDMSRMINLVRASSTLPGMMKPLPIDGKVYLDGGLGERAGLPLYLAEEAGYQRFFFVATRPRGYRKTPPTPRERRLLELVSRGHEKMLHDLMTRWERYNTELDRIEGLAREGRCYIVYPDEMPVSSATVDQDKLLASYNQGHAQGMRDLPLWREFLFGSREAGPRPDPSQVQARIRKADGADGYIVLEP